MTRLMTLALAALLTLDGCAPRRDRAPANLTGPTARPTGPTPAGFTKTENERVVLLVLDLTGPAAERMAKDGVQFALRVIDKYFRDSIGTDDKLVIAQVSSNGDRSLLWEGKPLDLRRQFPTADAFRDFLLSKADPNGAQVYKGLQNALHYVHADPRVASGQARLAVFVLSGMLDTSPNARNDELYLNYEVSVLGRQGAAVGLYYVDQQMTLAWRQRLQAYGVTNCVVMGDFTGGDPPLPSFEQ